MNIDDVKKCIINCIENRHKDRFNISDLRVFRPYGRIKAPDNIKYDYKILYKQISVFYTNTSDLYYCINYSTHSVPSTYNQQKLDDLANKVYEKFQNHLCFKLQHIGNNIFQLFDI